MRTCLLSAFAGHSWKKMYVHEKINDKDIPCLIKSTPIASEQIAEDCQVLANDHHLETGTSPRETH